VKVVTLFFFLIMVQSHCEVHRPTTCQSLKEQIDSTYKRNARTTHRMKMLLRYDELGCEEVVPLGNQ